MVGRAHADLQLATRRVDREVPPALALDAVTTSAGHRDISVASPARRDPRAGLVGAGRSELARAVLVWTPSCPARCACTAGRCASAASGTRSGLIGRIRLSNISRQQSSPSCAALLCN
jgi:hypothetical protein